MDDDLTPLTIARALPDERRRALELLFAHLPAPDRQPYLEEYATPQAAEIWGACRGDHLVAAVLAQVQPGRTAIVRIPRLAESAQRPAILELLLSASKRLASQEIVLLQALLDMDETAEAELLSAAGFHQATELLYLVSLLPGRPRAEPDDGLEFVAYSDAAEQRLAQLVARTYRGSLDCPQLDALRNVDDVLAGYRGVGQFDPQRWWFVRQQGRDVGCLLLAENPGGTQWEVTYLGVVPEARGHGLGLAIVRFAQRVATAAGCERLVLAVDANNRPALDVYAAAGLVAWRRRRIFLRRL